MRKRYWLGAATFVAALLCLVGVMQGRLRAEQAVLAAEQRRAADAEALAVREAQRRAALRADLPAVERLERGLVAGASLPGALFGLVEAAEQASGAVAAELTVQGAEPVGGLTGLKVSLRGEAPGDAALVGFLRALEGAGQSVAVQSVAYSTGAGGKVTFQLGLLVVHD